MLLKFSNYYAKKDIKENFNELLQAKLARERLREDKKEEKLEEENRKKHANQPQLDVFGQPVDQQKTQEVLGSKLLESWDFNLKAPKKKGISRNTSKMHEDSDKETDSKKDDSEIITDDENEDDMDQESIGDSDPIETLSFEALITSQNAMNSGLSQNVLKSLANKAKSKYMRLLSNMMQAIEILKQNGADFDLCVDKPIHLRKKPQGEDSMLIEEKKPEQELFSKIKNAKNKVIVTIPKGTGNS